MIKKADILLGIFLIVLCLSGLFFLNGSDTRGDLVTVTVDGQLYGTYDLTENRQIKLQQERKTNDPLLNIIDIKDGTVTMIEANCKNQVCVHQGTIRQKNQTVVCLPNRVVISIDGVTGNIDAISY